MAENNVPATPQGAADIAQELARLIGDTGNLQNVMGAFRVRVAKPAAFPWEQVFRVLLLHGFSVGIACPEANLVIEARL